VDGVFAEWAEIGFPCPVAARVEVEKEEAAGYKEAY